MYEIESEWKNLYLAQKKWQRKKETNCKLESTLRYYKLLYSYSFNRYEIKKNKKKNINK